MPLEGRREGGKEIEGRRGEREMKTERWWWRGGRGEKRERREQEGRRDGGKESRERRGEERGGDWR